MLQPRRPPPPWPVPDVSAFFMIPMRPMHGTLPIFVRAMSQQDNRQGCFQFVFHVIQESLLIESHHVHDFRKSPCCFPKPEGPSISCVCTWQVALDKSLHAATNTAQMMYPKLWRTNDIYSLPPIIMARRLDRFGTGLPFART